MKNLFAYVTLFVVTTVAFWAAFRWKRSSSPQRLLTILLLVTTLADMIEVWLYLHKTNNLWVSHLYDVIECVFFLSIFYLWKQKILHKRILLFIGVSFLILWLASKFSFEPFIRDDTYTAAIAKIIEISMAIWILFDVLHDPYSIVRNDERTWISFGIIIYSAGSILLFALLDTMIYNSPGLVKPLWIINWVISIVATLCYARGIWCRSSP
jgi:hypothetical protein